jgi:hypothetical protein
MDTWQPIGAEELGGLLAAQFADCSADQKLLFERYRVSPYLVPITRLGKTEAVFVVAIAGEAVLYYEDVEEGFNISRLSPSGAIATSGFEQRELRHALEQLEKLVSASRPAPQSGRARPKM